jgi:hypothetical protein
MKVEELKNYGKSFAEVLSEIPLEVTKQMKKTMLGELRRGVGIIGMARLMWKVSKEVTGMKEHDWSRLRERGLDDDDFIEETVQKIALMKALAEMVGMEKASGIHRKVFDRSGFDLAASMFPSVEDFRACGDVFASFKKYSRASQEANERAGIHRVEITEDTDTSFVFTVTYCAFHEVALEFGNAYLCYPSSCYGDEVFFPEICIRAGLRFTRTGTLATGATVCDFRFEHLAAQRRLT